MVDFSSRSVASDDGKVVMLVLGISAYYHDSAAALVEDGRIVAAAQEERFTRKKFDEAFPAKAIRYCLDSRGIRLRDVDHVVFYDKPFLKFERLLETYLAYAPRGFKSFVKVMPVWLGEKLFQRKLIGDELAGIDPAFESDRKLLFTEHHHAHAASAFFASPFERAVVLTLDGVGEWCTTSVALGNDAVLDIVKEIHFPHSLGLLYSAFTQHLGFRVNSGEYKLMGLAPYGEPKYRDLILDNLIDVKVDGSFKLDMSYFDYCIGLTMINGKFEQLLGLPTRAEDEPLTQRHMDVAASIQNVLDHIMVRLTQGIAADHGGGNLCLAGGVALNCVSNAKILKDGRFKNIWVQPAAGDAGGALGAALAAYHIFLGQARVPSNGKDGMAGSYLGPCFSDAEIQERLRAEGARFEVISDEAALIETTARALADEQAVGWCQGRMEFGPRALGNRSILADPRSPAMQRVLNLKVKYRESFRPFAPAVLAEDAGDWFDLDRPSPYMLLVADVIEQRRRQINDGELSGLEKLNVPRSEIPAVTHLDYSARVQTVHADTNPRFHRLLATFKRLTGCPVLVNTSFNVRGEPIVCSPEDAFRCLMGTDIEVLAIGNCVLYKNRQNPGLLLDYRNAFDPD
jgi:carbamoyltransferase